jgi:hypothetical protein
MWNFRIESLIDGGRESYTGTWLSFLPHIREGVVVGTERSCQIPLHFLSATSFPASFLLQRRIDEMGSFDQYGSIY